MHVGARAPVGSSGNEGCERAREPAQSSEMATPRCAANTLPHGAAARQRAAGANVTRSQASIPSAGAPCGPDEGVQRTLATTSASAADEVRLRFGCRCGGRCCASPPLLPRGATRITSPLSVSTSARVDPGSAASARARQVPPSEAEVLASPSAGPKSTQPPAAATPRAAIAGWPEGRRMCGRAGGQFGAASRPRERAGRSELRATAHAPLLL